ncbi:MAG TPA: Crp/Fnr family transcriptional regulator [Cytophagaceae bacterium]|jgi:CRP/FNR family cyclic AMP-dependent transcriptional regulator|nr:Crp/Fnr family transcriptional regulator [Cytophagaceae bacterium]
MNIDDSNFILLRQHRLFKQLTYKECSELNIVSGFMNKKKNEFIYLNSLKNDRLYFLKKGYIKIGTYDKDGNEKIKEVLNQGDIFGQLSLEGDTGEQEFAQVIKSDAQICSFSVEDFERILMKRPDLAISYTKLVGLRIKALQSRITSIIYKDVKSRIVDFFIYIARKERKGDEDQLIFKNYLTHAEVASLVGCTRQTATTFINQLEEEGLLEFNRQHIKITSLKKLEALTE